MKKNALKTLALLLAAVLVLGSFAGCGEAVQEPSAEPVTITFWHTYSDSEEAQLLDVVLRSGTSCTPRSRSRPCARTAASTMR